MFMTSYIRPETKSDKNIKFSYSFRVRKHPPKILRCLRRVIGHSQKKCRGGGYFLSFFHVFLLSSTHKKLHFNVFFGYYNVTESSLICFKHILKIFYDLHTPGTKISKFPLILLKKKLKNHIDF